MDGLPPTKVKTRYRVASTDRNALEGKAVRKEITISFAGHESGPKINMLLYLPAHAKGPTPVFVGLNFGGNHTVHADPGITLPSVWIREQSQAADPRPNAAYVHKPATEESRGRSATQWQVERILARGYGLATAYYGDIEPDFDGGWNMASAKCFCVKVRRSLGRTNGEPSELGHGV